MIKQILDLGMLHGTTFGNLGAILRQGLRPHVGYSPHQTKTLDAVFLTDSREAAMMYATAGRDHLMDLPAQFQPVILEIDTSGLPLEPDSDDAGLTIEVDLSEFNRELADLGVGPLKLGQPIPAQHSEAIHELIQAEQDFGVRAEPFMLQIEENASGVEILTVPDPYVLIGLPHDVGALPQVYDEVDATWEDGSPYLLARQWLCRCAIPYDRITGVYVPQWLPSMLGLQPKQVLEHANWLDPGMLLETGDVDWPYAWRKVPMIRLPKPALDALLKRRTTVRQQG